jgi:isopenicillin N synthase-like dioxygenase
VISGRKVAAVRHRVRRVPGVGRLSAVLFVAPDLDVKMTPAEKVEAFSEIVNEGLFDVSWFKKVMEQDIDVERSIWK